MLTDTTMYKAFLNRDISYDGIFFVAVKTTGIFCRPTCTAKKPKRKNIEFFMTIKDAITNGYRPCKICHPLEKFSEPPRYIKDIIKSLENNPVQKFKDADLKEKGIAPGKIRRWFMKNYNMTFHSFQRMYRINSAFKKLQDGESVISTAYDSGYESLSGFNDSFKSIFGVSPSNSKTKNIINLTRIETPIGTMFAGAVKESICLLEFSDRRALETELKFLAETFNAVIIQGENKYFDLLRAELNKYFEGKLKKFSVPVISPGTDFQKEIWKQLQSIPYGTTRSYKEQASAVGKPKAIRAVANANGKNRISIIIPCHRVIGNNGQLTGYGGGLWRKKWLLDLEMKNK